jgi:hypothetical protein
MIEDTGYFLLFLRPKRFGKSLLLSMLERYSVVSLGFERLWWVETARR